jgi:hypothetical protein
VVDALRPYGRPRRPMPCTPHRVWQLVNGRRSRRRHARK